MSGPIGLPQPGALISGMGEASLVVESPLGPLLLRSTDEGATALLFEAPRGVAREGSSAARGHINRLAREVRAYFARELRNFETPLAPRGTEFQQRVWSELLRIPLGETITYGELARRIGNPAASRAVGAANGANQLAIVVPCHRVIHSGGRLHGYAGGVDRKARLLEHERAMAPLFAC